MRGKKVIKKFSSEPLGNFISLFVLLITVIATFVPFFPEMPAADLDSSWKLGMNQAAAQGLSFGKEIIFTFGPYASIYTKSYHPFTDFMMLGGSLYLALSYWGCCVFLMKGTQWRWVLAFCVVLAGFMSSRDALLFSLPFVVGLLTSKILISEEAGVMESKWGPVYVALLFAPFGLLPLIKGSIFALCGPVAILCCVLFLIH